MIFTRIIKEKHKNFILSVTETHWVLTQQSTTTLIYIYFLHSKHAQWTTQQNKWQNKNSFHTSLINCYKFVKFVITVC